MSKAKVNTPGAELEQQLLDAIRAANKAPLPGGRALPVLYGIDRRGDFVDPQENVLVRAGEILVNSGRVYTYYLGNNNPHTIKTHPWRDLRQRGAICSAYYACRG